MYYSILTIKNIFSQGKEVIEYYIKEIMDSGTTYIAPWKPPESAAVHVRPDNSSQDSGLRTRSNSSASVHSHSSQSSLLLGATAASLKTEKLPTDPEGL